LQGSSGSGASWSVGTIDGGNNLDADPMFTDPDGADDIPCTADDNFYLDPSSPALNSGSSNGISDFPTEDLNGDDRVQDGIVDIGPYEGSGAVATFPVEWLGFTAAWSGQAQRSVDLSWATAQEINSQAFVIERSIDQARTWASIGQVSAAGYSDDIRRYAFSDQQAGELLGVNLQYRIKQIDLYGAFSYSTVQNVSMNHDLANTIQVYPNPARENLYLATDLARGIEVSEISVLDLSGKTLISQTIYEGSQEVYQLSLGQLKPGTYVVHLRHNQGQAGQLIRVLP
ncbi:MAG: T9SS type A sorting domain-containing protein, partial [Bacteroidota bacterium]